VLADTVGFAIGFGAFIVAFAVLAFFVIRFAGRLGRRTGPSPGPGNQAPDGRPTAGREVKGPAADVPGTGGPTSGEQGETRG
jgi:hypothetical protein